MYSGIELLLERWITGITNLNTLDVGYFIVFGHPKMPEDSKTVLN